MSDSERTPLHDLHVGDVLKRPVYLDGRTLFASGKVLTKEDIQELKLLNVDAVSLRDGDQVLGDLVQTDVLTKELRDKAISIVQRAYQNFQNLDREQATEIYSMGLQLIDAAQKATHLGIAMHDLREHSQYTYCHCVNVAAISLAIGVRMGLDRKELDNLAVGALLHDIGKMQIGADILDKEGPLTREEIEVMHQHPEWGWGALKKQNHFSPVVWAIARQHHETMDGGGYPDHISGQKIHLLARIVAVVDVWDALRSDRPYRKAWNPDQILDFINGVTMVGKYDPQVLEIFNNLIVPYPIGTRVMITGGAIAHVCGLNFMNYSRPIVRLDTEGSFTYIDLSVRKNVKILSTLELAT